MVPSGLRKREQGGESCEEQVGHGSPALQEIGEISPMPSWPLAGLSRRDAFRTLLTLARPLGRLEEFLLGQDGDVLLKAFSDELRGIEAKLKQVLAGDDRDATDIPGYLQLADRHAALVEILGSVQARGKRGLLAKARAVAVRDARAGYDGAISIAISLATDVVAILGAEKEARRF